MVAERDELQLVTDAEFDQAAGCGRSGYCSLSRRNAQSLIR